MKCWHKSIKLHGVTMKLEMTGSFQTFESNYQTGHYHISEDRSLDICSGVP